MRMRSHAPTQSKRKKKAMLTFTRTPVTETYELVVAVDYSHCTPNGDLNAGGAPRIDPNKMTCIVSGESLRYKMRSYICHVAGLVAPYDVLIRGGEYIRREDGSTITIDDQVQRCREDAGFGKSPGYLAEMRGEKPANEDTETDADADADVEGDVAADADADVEGDATADVEVAKKSKSAKKRAKKVAKGAKDPKMKDGLTAENQRSVRSQVAKQFVDVRGFGGVLKTGNTPLDGFKGAFTISAGESIHPVVEVQVANTRQMVTRERDKKQRGQTIGNHTVLSYALVMHHATLCVPAARATGMTMEDFHLMLEAMINCWTFDTSSHRRGVLRGLWAFKSKTPRRPVPGDWPDILNITCKLDDPQNAKSIADFNFPQSKEDLRLDLLPPGVEVLDLKDIIKMIGLYDDAIAEEAAQ